MIHMDNKSILITGGTGSLGKALVRRLLPTRPNRLAILSRDELKQSEMKTEFPETGPIRYFLGDVRNLSRLTQAFRGANIVIHTAAMKQVPSCESHPRETIATNVMGAINVIDAATANKVDKVVALSTDKACYALNTYGAAKLLSDKLFTHTEMPTNFHQTIFSVVRYGNVAGSRGSVIPFYLKLGDTQQQLPVTHRDMSRFWLDLDCAVDAVMYALENAIGGEIFVPQCPSFYIYDLAKVINPHKEPIIVGLRPGEKINESLIAQPNAYRTTFQDGYYVIHPYRRLPNIGIDLEYTSDANKDWLRGKELRTAVEELHE